MRTTAATLLATFILALPATALAQGRPWLSDRSYGEGIGIRTGDLELHPGLAGEVGYDSNYFQRSGDAGSAIDSPIYPAFRMRVTPSLSLSTLSPQRRLGDAKTAAPPKFNFRAGIYGSYNELIGTKSGYDFSKQRHLDAGANLALDILPKSPWGADLGGSYVRTIQPSNDPSTASAWDRDTFNGSAGVTWRPGGGLFDWRLGYGLAYTLFERNRFSNLNNAAHTVDTRGRFRFLPRTALLYDAKTTFVRFGSATGRNNGQTIQSRLGLNGLVTNRFALLVLGGWAASFYRPTAEPVLSNYDDFVGQAELKWFILPQPQLHPGDATVGLSTVAVGYVRDFNRSYLADYYQRDRGYLKFSYFVGGRFLVDVEGGYARIGHPRFQRSGVTVQPLVEHRIDSQLFAEYRLSDTIGINTTLRYDASLRDVYVPLSGATAAATARDNLAFSRFTGFVGARWFL